LGEGPVWRPAENAVWFVDIKECRIHRFDVAAGTGKSWSAPEQPGFIAPIASGGFLCGLKNGLHRFDPATGAFTFFCVVEPERAGNRLNDGFVDAKGRLWFGSMDDGESESSGALYRLTEQGCLRCDAPYVITNGPAMSPDGRTLYHTDTLSRTIYAFDVAEDGGLSNKRVFVNIEKSGAYPDGPTVDAEGCLWTGLFGGWCLERYSPQGKLLQTVSFPCANITKAAFGGADLRTLYVTTAWKGLGEAARAEQPLAGGLFAMRVDVPGLPQGEIRDGV
jgi:sugar lactone lactonase YvrE